MDSHVLASFLCFLWTSIVMVSGLREGGSKGRSGQTNVLKYFKKVQNTPKAKCPLFLKELSYPSWMTNLRDPLTSKHPCVMNPKRGRATLQITPLNRLNLDQSHLHLTHLKLVTWKFIAPIVDWASPSTGVGSKWIKLDWDHWAMGKAFIAWHLNIHICNYTCEMSLALLLPTVELPH